MALVEAFGPVVLELLAHHWRVLLHQVGLLEREPPERTPPGQMFPVQRRAVQLELRVWSLVQVRGLPEQELLARLLVQVWQLLERGLPEQIQLRV